jgi:hypothetical protein
MPAVIPPRGHLFVFARWISRRTTSSDSLTYRPELTAYRPRFLTALPKRFTFEQKKFNVSQLIQNKTGEPQMKGNGSGIFALIILIFIPVTRELEERRELSVR